jgi:asparagine synthase (glutamine-hydrolysing)
MGAIAVQTCDEPVEPQSVLRMLDPVPHRGAVRACATTGPVAVAVLGHGNDAWLAERDGWVAAFVGRLDNVERIRREFPSDGDRSLDPAGLLLAGARRNGVAGTVARMRGRFAFAVAHNDALEVGRDHLGNMPFFVAERPRRSVFATEIKQVLAGLPDEPQEPDLTFLEGLMFGVEGDWRITPYRGVERLPRASVVTYQAGRRQSVGRYWEPSPLLESRRVGRNEAAEGLAAVLEEAVSRVVTGQDAIGLSGGIDSPTVAAFAAPRHLEIAGRPLLALSAVFPEHPDVDEEPYVRKVVEDLGLELTTFQQVARPLEDLDRWVRVLDGPGVVPSIPAIAEMYRLTTSQGRSTLLTGEFAEYVYNYEYETLGYLIARRRWSAARSRVSQHRASGRTFASLGREIALSLAPTPLYRWWKVGRGGSAQVPWIDPARHIPPPQASAIPGIRERWANVQLLPATMDFPVHGDDVEACAAACGIVLRTPIDDPDVWEFMLSLPAEVKYPTVLKKGLVRDAMRGRVPDVILDRTDKTLFDSHGMSLIDYETLHRWLFNGHRLSGIDYERLSNRLENREVTLKELDTVHQLARIHAFLERW